MENQPLVNSHSSSIRRCI